MKSRKEIKGIAKDAFYRQYWLCVGANVIVMALCSVLSGISLGVAAFILVPSLVIGLNFFSVAMYRGDATSLEDIFRRASTTLAASSAVTSGWSSLFICGRCCS